jgi:hypothetical protein
VKGDEFSIDVLFLPISGIPSRSRRLDSQKCRTDTTIVLRADFQVEIEALFSPFNPFE